MATRMNPRSQRTIPDDEELIEIGEKEETPMKGVSDIENGGETEETAKGGKDSIVDVRTMLLSFIQQIQESYNSTKKELQESMRKNQLGNNDIKKELKKNREIFDKFENRLRETRL
jgi:hypothetical protein